MHSWQILQPYFGNDLHNDLIYWTPEVALKGLTCITREQDGYTYPKLYGDDDDKTHKEPQYQILVFRLRYERSISSIKVKNITTKHMLLLLTREIVMLRYFEVSHTSFISGLLNEV
jgi:hypothetical protein